MKMPNLRKLLKMILERIIRKREDDDNVNDAAVEQEVPKFHIEENVLGEDVEDVEEREMELNVEELIEMENGYLRGIVYCLTYNHQ